MFSKNCSFSRKSPFSLTDPRTCSAETAGNIAPHRMAVVKLPIFRPLPGVPATRADCLDGPRPCRYVRCKYHLWRIDSCDRAGNPNNGKPPTTLRAAWLETPMPPSCALDLVDEYPDGVPVDVVARVLGMHRANVWLILDSARSKLDRLVDELEAPKSR